MSESLRGHLLISSVRLGDPNFARTVVLMLMHDEQGALGLVLNRPTEISLTRLARELFSTDAARTGQLYRGGPCESSVMAVFTAGTASAQGTEICPGVRFSSERETLQRLLARDEGQARIFAGYSGWAVGQLEGELEEEAWLVLPARADYVFASHEHLWEIARSELMLGKEVNPATLPPDPSLN